LRKVIYPLIVVVVLLAAAILGTAGKSGSSLDRGMSAEIAPRVESVAGNSKADPIGMVWSNSQSLGSIAIGSSEDAWQVTIAGEQITDVACSSENGDLVVSVRVEIPEQNDYSAELVGVAR
jgi:hypothetical protein